jgi:hypothetical protein
VLADSPLAYWRLGESGGSVAADSGGNGHSGTYVGNPTVGVAARGARNGAFQRRGHVGRHNGGSPSMLRRRFPDFQARSKNALDQLARESAGDPYKLLFRNHSPP